MRSFSFFFGLMLIGLGLGGGSVLPEGGSSAKSALPNVVVGVAVLITGASARAVLVLIGTLLMAFSLYPYVVHKLIGRK